MEDGGPAVSDSEEETEAKKVSVDEHGMCYERVEPTIRLTLRAEIYYLVLQLLRNDKRLAPASDALEQQLVEHRLLPAVYTWDGQKKYSTSELVRALVAPVLRARILRAHV